MTSTRSPHIVIANHVQIRDFAGCILLKFHLERKYGYRVSVVGTHVNGRPYWDWVEHVAADAVVFPKLMDPDRFVERYQKSGRRLPLAFVLQTEHSDLGFVPDQTAPLPAVDCVLAWNQDLANHIHKVHDIPHVKMRVTGHPRFDWLHRSFDPVVGSRSEILQSYGVPPDWPGPVVTIAGSFAHADVVRRKPNIEESIRGTWKRFAITDVESWLRDAEDANVRREAFLQLAKTLSSQRQDVWTLIKPHPIEDASIYLEALQGFERISIIENDYAFRFLRASDLHVHHRCTTALEAIARHVPCVDFSPTVVGELRIPWLRDGSLPAETEAEVLEHVDAVRENRLRIPEDVAKAGEAQSARMMTCMDGRRGEMCAEAIHQVLIERLSPPDSPSEADALGFWAQALATARKNWALRGVDASRGIVGKGVDVRQGKVWLDRLREVEMQAPAA